MNVNAIDKKLYILIILLLLSSGGAGFFLLNKASQKAEREYPLLKEVGYFIPLHIHGYSPSNMPFVEVDIENRTIPAIIDLGFQGMFSLPPILVKDINKRNWVKLDRTYGLRGKIYENDIYEIENIKIGKMSFPSVKINEENLKFIQDSILEGAPLQEYRFGTIGWELFTEYNLLVDCRQYILALCDSVKTLKQQHYPVEAFTETSLISSDFLIIEAVTEEGPIWCLLDTGSTWNLLNCNLENEDLFAYNDEDIQEFTSFKIEGNEFGPTTFRRIQSPVKFDAILGMEFFDSHLVFIDFENKKVHIAAYPKETWPKPNLRPTIGPMRIHNVF